MTTEFEMTRDEAIRQVVATLDGPTALEEVVNRVLEFWPSTAKTAKSGIRTALRQEHVGSIVIFLDDETVVPISIALYGVTFRISVDRQLASRGMLPVYPAFTCFLSNQVSPETVKFVDAKGISIPITIRTQRQTVQSLFGPSTHEERVFDLTGWCRKNNVSRGDSLLVTVLDWEDHRFRLVHEAAKIAKKRRSEIQQRNQALADQLFSMLESARNESLWRCRSILTAHVRLPEPGGYPGDHWLEVLERDGRMRWDGYSIQYAEHFSPLERVVFGKKEVPVQKNKVSTKQAGQVYVFKAELWYRKGLWRRIEIQGGQTLGDFDFMLRDAFEHDFSDHMSGFWKRIRRGHTRRFREVDLGSLEPFGGGEAADVLIAGLELEPGDELKYVYDFGDWIQHKLTLEAIKEPDKAATYPRVVDQNKPRYQYCQHCREQGKKTIATWVCIDCSNREQTEILTCKDCLETYHPDHYADEILY